MPKAVDLAQKYATFTETWAPRIVGRYEGHEVRIARLDGEFDWHRHDHEELFFVIEGELEVAFRDHVEVMQPGQLLVIPARTDHRPAARHGEVKLMMMDPAGSPNTGDEATATKAVEA
ncbi:cupin domain-containing protein [Sphingomicrobium arenosum]|uniref:cupin domain-containing protein n=1 Tax=Sphingomicrobium arenosum TaxID=2233861 RepID=UPI002240F9B1|nr:cupin domain-containing protein [Sphingomicrobium arenosum]